MKSSNLFIGYCVECTDQLFHRPIVCNDTKLAQLVLKSALCLGSVPFDTILWWTSCSNVFVPDTNSNVIKQARDEDTTCNFDDLYIYFFFCLKFVRVSRLCSCSRVFSSKEIHCNYVDFISCVCIVLIRRR